MNILQKIIAHKEEEVAVRKLMVPEKDLFDTSYFARRCLSLKQNLLTDNATGLIAEFKRKSPSKGFINEHADVLSVTGAYTRFGASGLSVLTDHEFFGGGTDDLVAARVNEIPILRKDFIIDTYQISAAKAMGADVILLIAACLKPAGVKELARYARKLGLEVLLELHGEDELNSVCDEVDMVGINNRDLKSFKVDIDRSLRLGKMLPQHVVKIAESGISDVAMIHRFKEAGFHGFLVGEAFMKAQHPGEAFRDFVTSLTNPKI
ncbi:MAG: indole-3-glycerol phosphate synthase [Ferruginibacter sp.]|nr:indole-3-glycerol phosphate synthase [Ferruginibacter sp.]